MYIILQLLALPCRSLEAGINPRMIRDKTMGDKLMYNFIPNYEQKVFTHEKYENFRFVLQKKSLTP